MDCFWTRSIAVAALSLSFACELPSSLDETEGGGPGDMVGGDNRPYCESVSDWPTASEQFENEVLDLVNEVRANGGAPCTDASGLQPLSLNPQLICAARKHSQDMALRDYFSHTNPDGEGPGDRGQKAGWSGNGLGENIAFGYQTPQQVMDGWLSSSGHCNNIMTPGYEVIGIGFYENYWTQVFGR